MFKGTDKIGPNQFSAIVEAQGGDDNAFTSWDYTSYFQRVAADRLPLVMKMEADRMRNLRLTEDDVVTEREVILEERAQRTDSNPGALLSEQMRAARVQAARPVPTLERGAAVARVGALRRRRRAGYPSRPGWRAGTPSAS